MAMGGSGGRGEVTSEINVTPMADVMLVLLIIFMVVTPMLQKSTSVELAETKHSVDKPEADKDDAVLVAITADGNFYLGPDRMELKDIGKKVANLLKDKSEKVVYIKSDAHAKYGNVVEVVDTVRASGVDQIGLITERIDEKKSEPAGTP
jgi:biopolymer transport protein ExbD/biopolymer transport protein TolR